MKGLFLRVGIDRGYGGCLSPIFENGSFEYIPIPERAASNEERTFNEIEGSHNDSLADFVPKRIENSQPHFDPEFDTYTYGEPSSPKRNQLKRLEEDDLLLFYAGLQSQDFEDKGRLYAVGYFIVEKSYNFKEMDKEESEKILKELKNNAHAKRKRRDDDLVIVKGKPEKSGLFSRARLIGTAGHELLPSLENVFGYDGSIMRAVGHWIDEEHLPKVKNWIDEGFSSLITDSTKLYSYVIPHDTGFAPNMTGGYCTLATCKLQIRRWADVEDWVIATGSEQRNDDVSRLIYVMRVEETESFDEFYHDDRFEMKKPENDSRGDNIYYKKEGKLVQDPQTDIHNSEKEKEDDLKTDRVLISSLFWYFGQKVVKIPSRFRDDFIKKGANCTSVENNEALKDFISWLKSNYRPGIHGEPRDVHLEGSSEGEASCGERKNNGPETC